MPNQEHIDLLKQGVETWNQWRREHSDIRPDLYEADFAAVDPATTISLAGANLNEAKLARASLVQTDLHKANLEHAILYGANFSGANLKAANLSRTDLMATCFTGANLSEADLHKAKIVGTYFRNTILNGADLSQAWMLLATFSDVDLRLVKGLDAVKHKGPSTMGIDTIIRSQGEIPVVFLRGAGVPDSFISYVRSLFHTAFQYYTCFISYSSRDEDFAQRLYADLQANGVRCWFAPEDLKIGDHYHQRVDESIRLYDKLVLILSEQAVQSAWVEREVVAAREKEDREQPPVLFPIRLDDAVMSTTKAWAADVRRRWHIGDFTQWKNHDMYQVVFERLLRDLKAEQTPKD